MNIFDKRPLSLILCIMLGGFVIFSFSDGWIRYLLLALPLLSLCLLFIPQLSKSNKMLSIICALALMLSTILSYLYFDVWFFVSDRFTEEVNVVGKIIETKEYDYYDSFTIKTHNVNGEILSSYHLKFNIDKEEASKIDIGDEVSFSAVLSPPENDYQISQGINGIAEAVSNITTIEDGSIPLKESIKHLREELTRYTIMLSDYDTGSLTSALLIGERDYLESSVRLDFRRIGISHLLAISGMHLVILSMAINKILYLFHIGKRWRTLATILFSLIYMPFTGFSVTVVRAGVMLIISSLLSLLSRGHDSFTTLSISVFIICLFTPYAIYDIALWLSAFATLGIIFISEYYSLMKPAKDTLRGLLRKFSSIFSVSVFANGATLLISAIYFGGISLVSPITSIIFSVLIEAIMYLGSIMMLIGNIIPINIVLSPLCRATTELANKISVANNIYVSTRSPIVLTAIIMFTVMLLLFCILKIRRTDIAIKTVYGAFISVFVTVAVITAINASPEHIIYTKNEKSDIFLISLDGETALISSAQYSKSNAYKTLEFAKTMGANSLDTLYFSHYAKSITDELDVILSNILVRKIHLPIPQNNEEREILSKIEKYLEKYNIKCSLYSFSDKLSVGTIEICPIYSEPYGEDSSMNVFVLKRATEIYTYISSGILESKNSNMIDEIISISDSVIFGSHGKKYSDTHYFTKMHAEIDCIILSGENIFLTQESLKYYKENGCEVYSHPSGIDILIKH